MTADPYPLPALVSTRCQGQVCSILKLNLQPLNRGPVPVDLEPGTSVAPPHGPSVPGALRGKLAQAPGAMLEL